MRTLKILFTGKLPAEVESLAQTELSGKYPAAGELQKLNGKVPGEHHLGCWSKLPGSFQFVPPEAVPQSTTRCPVHSAGHPRASDEGIVTAV